MSTSPPPSGPLGGPRGIGFGILLFIVTLGIQGLYCLLIIPAIVWFVKIQGALNRYWESTSVASAATPVPA